MTFQTTLKMCIIIVGKGKKKNKWVKACVRREKYDTRVFITLRRMKQGVDKRFCFYRVLFFTWFLPVSSVGWEI